jgi:hypothetical protein
VHEDDIVIDLTDADDAEQKPLPTETDPAAAGVQSEPVTKAAAPSTIHSIMMNRSRAKRAADGAADTQPARRPCLRHDTHDPAKTTTTATCNATQATIPAAEKAAAEGAAPSSSQPSEQQQQPAVEQQQLLQKQLLQQCQQLLQQQLLQQQQGSATVNLGHVHLKAGQRWTEAEDKELAHSFK